MPILLRSTLVPVTALVLASLAIAQSDTPALIPGFNPTHSAAEIKLESQFKSAISRDRIREYHRYFTSVPHPAGTKADCFGE